MLCRAVLLWRCPGTPSGRRITVTRNATTGNYSAGGWTVEPMQWPGRAAPLGRMMGELILLPNHVGMLSGGGKVRCGTARAAVQHTPQRDAQRFTHVRTAAEGPAKGMMRFATSAA